MTKLIKISLFLLIPIYSFGQTKADSTIVPYIQSVDLRSDNFLRDQVDSLRSEINSIKYKLDSVAKIILKPTNQVGYPVMELLQGTIPLDPTHSNVKWSKRSGEINESTSDPIIIQGPAKYDSIQGKIVPIKRKSIFIDAPIWDAPLPQDDSFKKEYRKQAISVSDSRAYPKLRFLSGVNSEEMMDYDDTIGISYKNGRLSFGDEGIKCRKIKPEKSKKHHKVDGQLMICKKYEPGDKGLIIYMGKVKYVVIKPPYNSKKLFYDNPKLISNDIKGIKEINLVNPQWLVKSLYCPRIPIVIMYRNEFIGAARSYKLREWFQGDTYKTIICRPVSLNISHL